MTGTQSTRDSARERKRQERQRKREAGLVKVEFWVPAEKVEKVRKAVEKALK